MTERYFQTKRVPFWLILEPNERQDKIIRWFKNHDAHIQEWPSHTFKDTLLSYKDKGWSFAFKEGQPLNSQLLSQAFIEHVKKVLHRTSNLDFNTVVAARTKQKADSDSDYMKIFDSLLGMASPIQLSHAFQVLERCHKADDKRYTLWLTVGPVNENVIEELADKVIRVGNGANFDIDITDMPKKYSEFLEEKLSQFINKEGN